MDVDSAAPGAMSSAEHATLDFGPGRVPSRTRGQRFELCAVKPRGRCIKPVRPLNGEGQIFSTWTVRRGDIVRGFLRLRLRVKGIGRAVDFVSVS